MRALHRFLSSFRTHHVPREIRTRCLADNSFTIRSRLPYAALAAVGFGLAGGVLEVLLDPTLLALCAFFSGLQALLCLLLVALVRRSERVVPIVTGGAVAIVLVATFYHVAAAGSASTLRLVYSCYLVAAMIFMPWGALSQAILAASLLTLYPIASQNGVASLTPFPVNMLGLGLIGTLSVWGARAGERHREAVLYRREMNQVVVHLTSEQATTAEELLPILHKVTEAATLTLDARRCGVWLLDQVGAPLRCIASHEATLAGTRSDGSISLAEAHVRMDAPVRSRGRVVGLLRIEHQSAWWAWSVDEQRFADAIANVVALALEVNERHHAEEALRASEERYRHAFDELTRRSSQLERAVATLARENFDRRSAEEELRQSRAQLRALSVRLLSVQEEERRRIAREIHDELGQVLTALSFELGSVQRKLSPLAAPASERLERMSALIDGAVESVQSIAHNLRPPLLDNLGLAAAVRSHAREFEERTAVDCRLAIDPEDLPVDPDRATVVFRLVQEALTNVARHSKATKVDVRLACPNDRLVLRIHDNGRGIRKDEAEDPSSLGIIGMRERLRPWNGNLSIRGRPTHGTFLRITIPLQFDDDFSIKESA